MRNLLPLVGLVLSLTGCGGGASSGPSALMSKGKTLYDLSCKSCHGAEGHGSENPPIRDFAKHPWRTSPDLESIKKSITEGVPGTSMPPFKSFSKEEVEAIATYTLTLAPKEPAPKPGPQGKARDFEKFGYTSIQPIRLAPGLDFFDDKHHPVSLEEWSGSWRVVHFWSKIGKEFEPDLKCLQKLAEELKSVKFIVIGGDEHDPDELAHLSRNAVSTLPLYFVKNDRGTDRFGIKTLPVTLILDPEGNLLARKDGSLDEAKLRELLTTIAL